MAKKKNSNNKSKQNEASSKRSAIQKIIVPETELRIFYRFMKLLDVDTWNDLAKFYCDNPKSLERLWDKSRKKFDNYSNPDGWNQGKRKDLPKAPELLTEVSWTNEFTAYLNKHDLMGTNSGYTFVRSELNPWNTRHGAFSNKLPATKSGRGGMDLLLKSTKSGFPVVGEVKVKDDKNAFFALIQAMTYAVELSTPNQLVRLRDHIDEFEELDPKKAKVEIAIIMVNPKYPHTRKDVISLIKKLNKRNKCLGLARITLLENKANKWKKHS